MKKIFAILFCCLTLITSLYINNNPPIFINYANEYEIYLSDYSDTSKQIKVNNFQFFLFYNIKGQSATVGTKDFNLNEFLLDMNAKIVHTSNICSGTSYYCYSKDIKGYKIIDGVKVNLHVAIQKDTIKLGSPIIYGSF